MTTAVKQPPNHDTLTCYTDYDCRLPDCVDRYRARDRERRRAHKAGTYNVFVDAEPARQHIQRLIAAGMSLDAIEAAAGITHLDDFVRPARGSGRGRRQRTTPAVEARILAVTPADRTVGYTDATGTQRRVQALIALGWPLNHIARHAGLGERFRVLERPVILVSTAKAVADTYDKLRRRRPERSGVSKSRAQYAKNAAARNRWAPPRYWDRYPDAIDDPDFTPEYGKTRSEILTEEATWLMATSGLDMEEAAERLGITRRHLDRAFADVREEAAA